MAVQAWTDMSILLGGYDMACRAKSMNGPDVAVAELDVTALCVSSGYTSVSGGIKSVSWSADVMQDFDADQVDEELGLDGGTLAASTPLTILPAGTADGSLGYTFRANQLEYTPISGAVGDVAMARLAGRARRGPVVRGTVLHPPSTARTSTANGTGRQLGALSSAQSMYAALHITAASGTTPTIDVKIQSDDNGSFTSPTDRITFSQASAAGWQWSSVAGAVTDDYWRVVYTIGGTGPSFQFCVVAGIATTV